MAAPESRGPKTQAKMDEYRQSIEILQNKVAELEQQSLEDGA